MKYTLLFTGLIFLAASCNDNPSPDDLTMKKIVITKQLIENREASKALAKDALKSMRPEVAAVAAKAKDVADWRENFQKAPTKENLVTYADSILIRYKFIGTKSAQVVNGLHHFRQIVQEKSDSSSLLSLQWYTLHAESAVLDHYFMEMGIPGHHYTTMYPTYINRSTFLHGDTVVLLVRTYRTAEESECFFDKVTCSNVRTGVSIKPTITRLQEFYLLRYLPKEKGRYEISGVVSCDFDVDHNLPIENEFAVE